MREKGCFPLGVDAQETLEFFFMSNATMLDCEGIAVIAGTLANGGICPTTGERVFTSSSVRNCLAMMFSCGHGDFSGEFAFRIGVPGKSSKPGCTMIVIPGVVGLCVWSPKLDEQFGISKRGVAVATQLCSTYRFHAFEAIDSTQADPRQFPGEAQDMAISTLLQAAERGDLAEIKRLYARGEGVRLDIGDYDDRTALHLAATSGNLRVVRWMVEQKVSPNLLDRWGHKPLDDAIANEEHKVAKLLRAAESKSLSEVRGTQC